MAVHMEEDFFTGQCHNPDELQEEHFHTGGGLIDQDTDALAAEINGFLTHGKVEIQQILWGCGEFTVEITSDIQWEIDFVLQKIHHHVGANGTHFLLSEEDRGDEPLLSPLSDPSGHHPMHPVPTAA